MLVCETEVGLEMNARVAKKLQKYLADALGIEARPESWRGASALPLALRDAYEAGKLSLFGEECLLLFDLRPGKLTPATIRKQADWAHRITGKMIVYVTEGLPAYNRKRLIEHKVPFVVPGNQMYLPDLGIDLRAHLRAVRSERELLRPATQLLVLYVILRPDTLQERLTPSHLARLLGYSDMTMTRAIDELEDGGCVSVRAKGRERVAEFRYNGRELWEKTHSLMRSPVKTRSVATGPPPPGNWPLAGLSALAERTMLAAPERAVFAVHSQDALGVEIRSNIRQWLEEEGKAEVPSCELEVWHYPPDLLAEGGTVDPLSLYLSLREISDERVEAALEELLGQVRW